MIRTAYEDGKSSVGFEMKVIRRDGKVRWLLTQCSFVKTVDGTIVYGYVSDCTDLKNMEEKTKTVQDVCRFTVNHDYEWILLVDIPADRYEYFFSGRNSMIGSGMQGVFSELVRLRSETVSILMMWRLTGPFLNRNALPGKTARRGCPMSSSIVCSWATGKPGGIAYGRIFLTP